MRQINLIVIHCSVTKENQSFTLHALEASHRKRGFNGIGYHCYDTGRGCICTRLFISRYKPD